MKRRLYILLYFLVLAGTIPGARAQEKNSILDFYGDTIQIQTGAFSFIDFASPLTEQAISEFYSSLERNPPASLVAALLRYRQEHQPDDWLFYQLIRKAAQKISPKDQNYQRYTLYKWYFLLKTGYDAILTIHQDQVLMYVQTDEIIYNIPSRNQGGKQYVCLNYHDYGSIDFEKKKFREVMQPEKGSRSFSYRITRLPSFSSEAYQEKEIGFTYNHHSYNFRVKLNPSVKSIFANYPVVEYEKYFNIPLSQETYSSLIPSLKKVLKKMNQKSGVEYLMHFTRYAFVYKPDTEIFGQEKRFSPEQTLLYEYSDCEDRAALFFYLVKEIYNLPMIVLAFPKHVTIAVKFDKPVGRPIVYKGEKYSICEPTPQGTNLGIGQASGELMKSSYEIVYSYDPRRH